MLGSKLFSSKSNATSGECSCSSCPSTSSSSCSCSSSCPSYVPTKPTCCVPRPTCCVHPPPCCVPPRPCCVPPPPCCVPPPPCCVPPPPCCVPPPPCCVPPPPCCVPPPPPPCCVPSPPSCDPCKAKPSCNTCKIPTSRSILKGSSRGASHRSTRASTITSALAKISHVPSKSNISQKATSTRDRYHVQDYDDDDLSYVSVDSFCCPPPCCCPPPPCCKPNPCCPPPCCKQNPCCPPPPCKQNPCCPQPPCCKRDPCCQQPCCKQDPCKQGQCCPPPCCKQDPCKQDPCKPDPCCPPPCCKQDPCCPPPPCCNPCPDPCETLRKLKCCQKELECLRLKIWKGQQRKALLAEKECMERMESQYEKYLHRWDVHQAKCENQGQRGKQVLKAAYEKLKEKKRLREEARRFRGQDNKLNREENRRLALKLEDKEEERYMKKLKLFKQQEDKLLDSQMEPRDTNNMDAPILEEMRRMFAPVAKGQNETYEYFCLEPRPTGCQIANQAKAQAAAMLGLRNEHGIHLNLSDRCQKRTTIQLAMGPKLQNGERKQHCNIISCPGASCIEKKPCVPNVPVPDCLKPLMQTLPFRVVNMDSPLLRMKGCGPGPGLGPNFAGNRLYGTLVLPKGKAFTKFYTDPYAITF